MKVSLRTVIFLCTLLLGMQLGALVHASEHLEEVDHVACQTCSHLDRFEDAATPKVYSVDLVRAKYTLSLSPLAVQCLLSPATYKQSRAPPAFNIS